MVRVGVVGTSWWADAMYLPALKKHPQAEVVAVCGRDYGRLKAFADRWNVPATYTDYRRMIADAGLDAIIVSTGTDSHYPISMLAIEHGLHVLCEKPLAMNAEQARAMADAARAKGVKTMVPFTYRFMPTNRQAKNLIDEGFIGKPYHLNMRYYTGYGRGGGYDRRFNADESGSGVIADLGSHWLHLARWYFGEITSLMCYCDSIIERPNHPDGHDYTRGEDSAVIVVRFANGAYGILQVTAVCWEGTPFGQTHHMEFHGSEGTIYNVIDWDTVQQLKGAKNGEKPRVLEVPESIWKGARRDTVHNTYRDIFREQDNMARGFITAIVEGRDIGPDFDEGARVQFLVDKAVESNATRQWIDVSVSEKGSAG